MYLKQGGVADIRPFWGFLSDRVFFASFRFLELTQTPKFRDYNTYIFV